ncbi:hypothetical protein CYFUS_001194 [Cystobacter fuscus]|uniref:Competence protein CoiA n=1 Tax=Cystobacter fuscus TaxID=43 RepID=A0A250IWY9_9BACT|nr:hypothetical protein [Cystobacter fuscus]ATB35780.1 hypothetical protein CYFUS_001194 [Cystobacter fuscus]
MLTIALRKAGGHIQVLEAIAFKGQPEGDAFCPSEDCGQPLVPVSAFVRVGNIPVRAFFRHRRGTAAKRPCWGAKGEGGLHFAAKLHLRVRLQELCEKGGALVVEQPCLRCAVGLSHEVLRTKPSDVVRIEHWLDPRRTLRPDVVLLRAGVPLLSFEVRASHPCSPKKIAALTVAGAQMVEVEAWVLLGTETTLTWYPSVPLPLKRAVLPVARQLCPDCQTAQDFEAACERAAEERRQREREEQQRCDAQRAREREEQQRRDELCARERQTEWACDAQRAHEMEVQREDARPVLRVQEEVARAKIAATPRLGTLPLNPRLHAAAPNVEVLAHCFVDVCRPDGVRDELELVLERAVGGPLKAQLVERRAKNPKQVQLHAQSDRRLLMEWWGTAVTDTDSLLQKARAAASAEYKVERDAGCIVDPHGGFRLGAADVSAWPHPNHWWEERAQRWVRARLRHMLADELKVSENAVDERLPARYFHRILVRFKRNKRDFAAYEAVGNATFDDWLRGGT